MAVKKIARKKLRDDKNANRAYGFILFCQRIAQNEIAERCEVSVQTISAWKKEDQWEAKRASKTISMDELVNKCLVKINELLDTKDFDADAFAKSVAQLKALKPNNTVDNEIMTFMAFQNFLLERKHTAEVSDDFIKKVTGFQDRYIQIKLGNNA